MDFRGQVRKWVSMITCIFWSEIVSGFGYIHAYPHQEFPGTPPLPRVTRILLFWVNSVLKSLLVPLPIHKMLL